MGTYIKFHIMHPFFREPLVAGMEWNFPFLPRVGESINPWVWIEAKDVRMSNLEDILTEEGKKSLKKEKYRVEDWLYEVGINDNDYVKSISYYRNSDENKKLGEYDFYLNIYLGDPKRRY